MSILAIVVCLVIGFYLGWMAAAGKYTALLERALSQDDLAPLRKQVEDLRALAEGRRR